MYILIDEHGAASLVEPDNFTAFEVLSHLPPTLLQGALATNGNMGWVDGSGHAWIAESWLRARGTAASGWLQQFEAMVGFARQHGWWDSKRSAIRAHIESVGVT